jgi:TP901 family phage tail tape measure protein
LDKAIGRHNRNVGNYTSSLKNLGRQLLGAAGVLSGVYLFTRAVRNAIRVTVQYNKSMASLSAITGLIGKDLAYFGREAKKASKTTLQSAISMLKAFERVGSIRPELLKAKEALVDVTNAAVILSESTGGLLSLEDAANAAAGAMNQFGLDSGEALRIVNTLAAGSLRGSSTTQQLSEAFKMFGAVAKAANISLEQSVGLVELAATKMILGSEAGTAIRGTLLKLQKASLGYASGQFVVNDAIDEANTLLDGMGTQMERDEWMLKTFGIRQIIFGNILLNNKDKFNELTEAVTGTNVALEQQMTQNDTLAGSMTRLSNAWDVYITGSSSSAKYWQETIDGWAQLLAGQVTFFEWIISGGKDWEEVLAEMARKTEVLELVTTKLEGHAKRLGISTSELAENLKEDVFYITVSQMSIHEMGISVQEMSDAIDTFIKKEEEARSHNGCY